MTAPPTVSSPQLRMSTAPVDPDVAPPPPRGGPRRGRPRPLAGLVSALVGAWRQLTRMRTALQLLFLLAVAAVPGSVLPQRGLNPFRVADFLARHRTLGPLFDRLSLFDVFAAPWFAAVYLLLFVSLAGCLWSRIRLHARALVSPPPTAPARPSRLAYGTSWHTTTDPEQVADAARRQLRKARWRVAATPQGDSHTVAAERGYLRETGNLVFHVSLVLLLVGVGLGSVYGYSGQVIVSEGESFTNTAGGYAQVRGGAFVDLQRLQPFRLHLDRFVATYQPSGEPKTFDAHVTYRTSLDGPARTDDIRIGHPLRIGNAKVYLANHGYSVHAVVHDRSGHAVSDQVVTCQQRGDDPNLSSSCVVKVGTTTPELGFRAVLFPTTFLDPALGFVSRSPQALAPGLAVAAWSGDLGIDSGVPQNIYQLDTTRMRPVSSGLGGGVPNAATATARVLALLRPGERTLTGLPGGYSLTVDGVRPHALFQVKEDPAKRLVLLAAVLIVAGLVASLRVRRRRLWVRATPTAGGRTLLEVGGLTRTDGDGFGDEFDEIAQRLRAAAPPAAGPAAAGPGIPTGGRAGSSRSPDSEE